MKSSLLLILFLSTLVIGQNNQIILDEKFDDWDNVLNFIEDEEDNLAQGVDYKKLWITNDDNYLFIRIDFYDEILLQEDTSTVIYLNTDNDTQTGSQEFNTGAEIKYNFGTHVGYFYQNNDSTEIHHNNIQLITAPTVSSGLFELGFALFSEINNESVFPSDDIKIKFVNNPGGVDKIPNGNDMLSYTIQREGGHVYPDYSLSKMENSSIRIMSYNVHRDDIFKEENYQYYDRIFNAVKPDIIAFQEIYDHTSIEVADLVEQFLPSGDGKNWYHAKVKAVDNNIYNRVDVLVISRFPIIESYGIQGFIIEQYGIDKRNSAHLIDVPNSDKHILLVVAHPPCCQNNYYREIELQEIMSFLKDAKTTGGELDIDKNTPIIITGDMNLVGPSMQRDILTQGNFIDNTTYGEDFSPDWDETAFVDSKPFTTNYPGVFTWYYESDVYNPGRLDYIIYSDYTLSLINSYSLFTKSLPEDTLQAHGLNSYDVILASDHLPVVTDFKLKEIVGISESHEIIPYKSELYQNYPNPFNPKTNIKFSTSTNSHVSLIVYDISGREVAELINKELDVGNYTINFNATYLASGLYLYTLKTDETIKTRKMILLK